MKKEDNVINLRGKSKKEILEAYKKIAEKSISFQEKIHEEKQSKKK